MVWHLVCYSSHYIGSIATRVQANSVADGIQNAFEIDT
jgi:hypothetical protein